MAHKIGIGIIGMGWMGQVHSRSYLDVLRRVVHRDGMLASPTSQS